MEIEPLDRQTVKIVLSKQDMDNFCLTYEDMNYNNPVTKNAVLKLLSAVKEKNKLDLFNGKLYIEAFPKDDGGCILYLNLISALKDDLLNATYIKSPIIASIQNPYHLIRLCQTLYNRFNRIILKSHLYANQSGFYLFLYSLFREENLKLCCLVKEYGKISGEGIFDSDIIKEHSCLIVENNALKTIARL